MIPVCPLCNNKKNNLFYQDKNRDYWKCAVCQLLFVPPDQFLSLEEEKARYDLHRNSPNDPEYRRFLSRLFDPMQQRVAQGSKGLDFGSGPGPTLSAMFVEAGYEMKIYDPFYAQNPEVLNEKYDFITTSEVVEHLHHPGQELTRLRQMLKPNGYLGIMTKMVPSKEAFGRWYYKNDPTHVCFFSKDTFLWLIDKWEAKIEFMDNDVVLIKMV
ncbi:class I SAM-dependent methyltransferase [bacterium]|nr:class I SAM-dependent methyltransferase [bacterium]MBT3581789.1 class I SAM-dependent methyltransferase [bacterium]MBT4552479.1 class I SAM-dependent methyltransferase [bacterium]MBT5988225.1 class I SAM-dependent methyltransferase [bacterium]MBT7087505.1 class I SAM-dependent methyltransferase [bacterium]